MGVKWGGARTLTLPGVNVRLGLRYLWKLERQFNDPYLAVAAYNLGPARVEQMSRERARGSRYVRKIMARYEDLLAEAPLRRT
jgi:soluble lytic murein transglycosylase-like protein